MSEQAVALVVDAAATYRLTRLVQRDTFPPVAAARKALLDEHSPDWRWELLDHCPWCLSFWVGLGVVAARRVAPRLWHPLAVALAASAVTGLISEREKD